MNFAIMGMGSRQDLVNISKKYAESKRTDEIIRFLSETTALDSLDSFKSEFSSLIRNEGTEKLKFFNEISKLFVKPKFKREDRVKFVEKLYEQSKRYYEMKKNKPLKTNFSFLGLEQETDLEKLKEIYNNYTLSRTTVSNKTKKQIDSIVRKLVKLAKAYPEEVDFLKFKRSVTVKYGDKEFTTPEREYVLGQRVDGEDPSKGVVMEAEREAIERVVSKKQRKEYALVDIKDKKGSFDATVNFTYSDYYQALKDAKRKIDLNLGLDVQLGLPERFTHTNIYSLFIITKKLKKNVKPVFDILFPERIGKDITEYALKDPNNLNPAFVSLFYQDNGSKENIERWLSQQIQTPKMAEQIFFDRTITDSDLQGRVARPSTDEFRRRENRDIAEARIKSFENVFLFPDDEYFDEFYSKYKGSRFAVFLGKKDGKQFVKLLRGTPRNFVRGFDWPDEKIEEYTDAEEFEPDIATSEELPEVDLSFNIATLLTEENHEKYYTLSDISNLGPSSTKDFLFSCLLLVDHFIKDNSEESENLSSDISSTPEALSDESSSLMKRVQALSGELKEGLVSLHDKTIEQFYNHIKSSLNDPNKVSRLLAQEDLVKRLIANKIIEMDTIKVEEEP